MSDYDKKVGSLSQLVELVRTSTAAKRGTVGTSGGSPQAPAAAGPRDVEDLKRRLKGALGGIDARAKDAARDGRRALVREIVLWEFGGGLAAHPEFAAMLEAVEGAVAADARLAEKFARVIAELKQG